MTGLPPATPPDGAPPPYPQPAPREGRSVSFYVAIFLALLLFISGGLNVLLLLVSALGSAAGGFGGGMLSGDDGRFQVVTVDGDRKADAAVLRVRIDGAIAEASSPLMGGAGGTVSQVRRALRAAARESSIRGVLLDINSPGGGVTDSDEIRNLIKQFRRDHPDLPVVSLLGDIAASGGYYIAAPTAHIMARPTTITGSIGVIISSYDVSEALGQIGVEPVVIVSEDTPFKDMLSMTRPMTEAERRKIRAIVQEMYERFVDVVDEGREELTRDEVKQLATGEVYSAMQAERLGLVDGIGSLADAYAKLADLMRVESVRVVEHRRVPTLFDTLFAVRAQPPTLEGSIAQLLRQATGPKLLYFWPGGR
ncbi:MAG: signal peptide peptidase SppA [Planctomycetota bacterium]